MNREFLWMRNYEILVDYRRRYRNTNMKPSYIKNGYKTGVWLQTQYRLYRQNKLLPKRILLLNKLNVDWSKNDTINLNKKITNMEVYNTILNERVDFILRDLKLEGYNEITSKRSQKKIENELTKKIWR